MTTEAERRGMTYLTKVPTEIPSGTRLVHNFPPGRPRRRAGAGGFRFWVEPDVADDRHGRCYCDWDAPAHWSTSVASDPRRAPVPAAQTPTEAEIRAAIEARMAESVGDYTRHRTPAERLRVAIEDAALVVDYAAFDVLDWEGEPEAAPSEPTIWWGLSRAEARQLRALVDAAKSTLVERCEALIVEELTAVGVAFAAKHPDAPRWRPEQANR
jgi:hypothetical protein